MNELEQFYFNKERSIERFKKNIELRDLGIKFLSDTAPNKYTYNFTWMGRPIIALPQDMIAMQEIIWNVKPDLIIETGIAHGGSIVYYASLLELIGEDGIVLGIDIDIRKHNRELIENHPMSKRIKMIEGSSLSEEVVSDVSKIASQKKKILICLDSNHTHDHVLQELKLYSSFTSIGSYCVVFDTSIEDMPENYDWKNKNWGKGNNPKTAIHEFMKTNTDFVVDHEIDSKLLISVALGGYLKRVK